MESMMICCSKTPGEFLFLDPNLVCPEHSQFADIIDCKICCGIIQDPLCCKSCDSIFCKKCIKDWIIRSKGKCPNRCDFVEYEIRRTTINLMNKIKLYCIYREKGCKEEIFYEDYKKHMKNCEFEEYECLGCKMKSTKSIITSHIKICPDMYKNCNYCFEKFLAFKINDHYESCQMFELPCKLCSLTIKRYAIESHLQKDCKEVLTECSFCETKDIKKKDEVNHTKQVCFEIFKKKIIDSNSENLERLKNDNKVLKKQIDEKDQMLRKLQEELNKLKGNSNNNSKKQENGLFENINEIGNMFFQNNPKNNKNNSN